MAISITICEIFHFEKKLFQMDFWSLFLKDLDELSPNLVSEWPYLSPYARFFTLKKVVPNGFLVTFPERSRRAESESGVRMAISITICEIFHFEKSCSKWIFGHFS